MDKPSLKAALHALAARQRSGEYHPTPNELIAYRARELPSAEEDRIQEHLTVCEDCVRLLLDLAEFDRFTPAAESIGPVDARTETDWQEFRSRFRDDIEDVASAEEADEKVAAATPAVLPFWSRPVLPWALAAGFALCSIGLGWRVGSLGRQLEEPQTVQVVTLESQKDSARGNGREIPVREGEGVAYDLLLPSSPEAPAYPLYTVKIVPAAGGAMSVPVGGQLAHEGALRVIFRSAPEAGDYFFEVFGIEGEREIPVSRYPFTILPPGAASG